MSVRGDDGARACDSPERELLPWAASGRLGIADAARVEAHVRECAECRAALAVDRTVAAAVAAEDAVSYSPAAGLNAFLAKLDDVPTAARAAAARGRFRERRLLLGAVAAQALVIAGLVALLFVGRSPPADYVTLSRSASTEPAAAGVLPAGARLHVVFAPDATASDLAVLLHAGDAEVVGGPSEAGVWTVAVARASDVRTVTTRLRADRRVRFVEPVAGGAP